MSGTSCCGQSNDVEGPGVLYGEGETALPCCGGLAPGLVLQHLALPTVGHKIWLLFVIAEQMPLICAHTVSWWDPDMPDPRTSRKLGMSQRSYSLLATEEADAVSSLIQNTKSYLYPMEGYWVLLLSAPDLAKGFLNKLSKPARLWQYWKGSYYSSFIVFF